MNKEAKREVPANIKPFIFHGVDLSPAGSQYQGDCPLCGKESHFYVNPKTGLWDCKVCGESGNADSFLLKLWRESLRQTTNADYAELSEDRGIPARVLKACGLAVSVINNRWLIPSRKPPANAKGIPNLCLCDNATLRPYSTAERKQQLMRPANKNQDAGTLWICEGQWDAMALQGVLQRVKADGKPLSDTNAVVGLPGAKSAHELLTDQCKGKDVKIVLDNDKSGREGTEGIIKTLGDRPASVEAIQWDEGLPEKYDVRDLVRDTKTAREAFQSINGMMQPIDLVPSSDFEFPFMTADELATEEFQIDYLIEDILCADHPCGIIGPSKTLKTTLVVDMAISLATGGRFLNYFNCRRVPVAVMSGESGPKTIQETAIRIADAYGFDFAKIEGFWFCPMLPRFANEEHLAKLGTFLDDNNIRVLIIDPAYLCVDTEGRESSLFAMGKQLARMGDLCRERNVTFVLVHHTTQGIPAGKTPKLQDASWAGFSQYLRQWVGINRRKEYVPGTGNHQLIMSAGGSMGHSSSFNVDVLEGTTNKDQRRFWKPKVVPKNKADEDAKDAKAKLQIQARSSKVLEAMKAFPKGETQRVIAEACGMNNANCGKVLQSLLERKMVKTVRIKKGRKQVKAYQLPPNDTGTTGTRPL